jgi:hypothetical protein
LEAALSQAAEFANTAFAALRIRSVRSGNRWTRVLRISVSESAAYLLSGNATLIFSSAAIFFSGSTILPASVHACWSGASGGVVCALAP